MCCSALSPIEACYARLGKLSSTGHFFRQPSTMSATARHAYRWAAPRRDWPGSVFFNGGSPVTCCSQSFSTLVGGTSSSSPPPPPGPGVPTAHDNNEQGCCCRKSWRWPLWMRRRVKWCTSRVKMSETCLKDHKSHRQQRSLSDGVAKLM